MRKAFDIEDLNLDDLIETAMADPQAVAGEISAFRGINSTTCTSPTSSSARTRRSRTRRSTSPGDRVLQPRGRGPARPHRLRASSCPAPASCSTARARSSPSCSSPTTAASGCRSPRFRNTSAGAFIAAEDKRFYQHKGIDERGLIRAFITNIAEPGRPQGGSTITQQVAKNLLVGDDVSYERKIREMIVASRIDQALSKDEILEVYLNSIYLGRGAWGIDMAARGYFKKPASDLTLTEGAMLAAMAKGPTYFSPDRYPGARARALRLRAQAHAGGRGRRGRGGEAPHDRGMPRIVPYERPRRETGFHFVDQLMREARDAGRHAGADRAVLHRALDHQPEAAARRREPRCRKGCARYEAEHQPRAVTGAGSQSRRARSAASRRQGQANAEKPAWQIALTMRGCRSTTCIGRRPWWSRDDEAATIRVGLHDGRIVPLAGRGNAMRSLKRHDVVYVHVTESKGGGAAKGKNAKSRRRAARAELRIRPKVQGAAVVLENKTGRILAMVGGFSYPLSQLNRTTQALRQPGSSIKPLIYLAALRRACSPTRWCGTSR